MGRWVWGGGDLFGVFSFGLLFTLPSFCPRPLPPGLLPPPPTPFLFGLRNESSNHLYTGHWRHQSLETSHDSPTHLSTSHLQWLMTLLTQFWMNNTTTKLYSVLDELHNYQPSVLDEQHNYQPHFWMNNTTTNPHFWMNNTTTNLGNLSCKPTYCPSPTPPPPKQNLLHLFFG
jgi:hypothetical protein